MKKQYNKIKNKFNSLNSREKKEAGALAGLVSSLGGVLVLLEPVLLVSSTAFFMIAKHQNEKNKEEKIKMRIERLRPLEKRNEEQSKNKAKAFSYLKIR